MTTHARKGKIVHGKKTANLEKENANTPTTNECQTVKHQFVNTVYSKLQ